MGHACFKTPASIFGGYVDGLHALTQTKNWTNELKESWKKIEKWASWNGEVTFGSQVKLAQQCGVPEAKRVDINGVRGL